MDGCKLAPAGPTAREGSCGLMSLSLKFELLPLKLL